MALAFPIEYQKIQQVNTHRLRYGLHRYLIYIAPHTFAFQCQLILELCFHPIDIPFEIKKFNLYFKNTKILNLTQA